MWCPQSQDAIALSGGVSGEFHNACWKRPATANPFVWRARPNTSGRGPQCGSRPDADRTGAPLPEHPRYAVPRSWDTGFLGQKGLAVLLDIGAEPGELVADLDGSGSALARTGSQ
ncbi:hypothetical protein GCM10027590_12370 [Nocardiopsis nanhaiensis]